jgi:predicted nucleic acid-binding Zn ribbon protein
MTTPATPSRDDGVTMGCPVCGRPFIPAGRRRFCSDACRARAWRWRRAAVRRVAMMVPAPVSRVPMTVYECDACGARAVGVQRCADCTTFMRRLGLGGSCPRCDEAITVSELVGLEVGP